MNLPKLDIHVYPGGDTLCVNPSFDWGAQVHVRYLSTVEREHEYTLGMLLTAFGTKCVQLRYHHGERLYGLFVLEWAPGQEFDKILENSIWKDAEVLWDSEERMNDHD